MRNTSKWPLALLFLGASLPLVAGPASAATLYVRVDGSDTGCTGLANRRYPGSGTGVACAKRTIQAAIDISVAGDLVKVGAGTFRENVAIHVPVTLAGSGAATVVEPAVSDPNCGGMGGGSLCAGSSNVLLVQADDVTIDRLVVDGDNPALTSGVVVGGADLDARNGIITDHRIRTLNDLVVSNVTVRNVFLRGIYASSGGSFDFHGDVIDNVQASPASIAMFNFGGSGIMSSNTVSRASDAISSNHSSGVQFLDNLVTASSSGVHTDNAGDGGGSPDRLAGNTVRDCAPDGYGVWTFVPAIAPLVESNLVQRCAVGLAAFGRAVPLTVTYARNDLRGDGSAGSVGIYVTTTDIGFGPFDVAAALVENAVKGFETGVYVQQDGGRMATASVDLSSLTTNGTGLDVDAATTTVTSTCILANATGVLGVNNPSAAVHTSQIAGNSAFGVRNTSPGALDATSNWWGSSSGPNPPGTGDRVSGNVNTVPFAVLRAPCGPRTPLSAGVGSSFDRETETSLEGTPPAKGAAAKRPALAVPPAASAIR